MESDILLPSSPRFYRSYLNIGNHHPLKQQQGIQVNQSDVSKLGDQSLLGDQIDIDAETLSLLKDRGFSKFIIENEDPVLAVKMIAYTVAHSLLKPQRLLIDDDDYYVAIDLFTNTYYICYRNLLMIDVDRYKQDIGSDTLNDLKIKLSRHPELFFRIYSTRNGYHIFVLNRKMDYKSDEAIRLMHEMGSDFYYIIYSYLRGWSVRLNKKKGEETRNVLYEWIGDVVCGHFFSSDLKIETASERSLNFTIKFEDIVPDERLEILTTLHINLVDVFTDVGLCSMPAPN